ncbi:MAG: motility protein A [Oscillospiraceae bacterium]
MDLSGIIGILFGAFMIFVGMITGTETDAEGIKHIVFTMKNCGGFFDVTSIAVTIGGTIAATLCCFPLGVFKNIGKHMGIIFGKSKHDPKEYIDTIVSYAQDARRQGILSLEDKVADQKNQFLKSSIMLIVDAIEPAKTQAILENELNNLDDRHMEGVKIYEKASSFAPAFGMIGTLIGLVNMLAGLDLNAADGASKLTSGMAVALLTTFYGSIFANLFLTPFATKLRYKHAKEMICYQIIVEGVLAIQAGDNPKNIEERLLAFLPQKERTKVAKGGKDKEDK